MEVLSDEEEEVTDVPSAITVAAKADDGHFGVGETSGSSKAVALISKPPPSPSFQCGR